MKINNFLAYVNIFVWILNAFLCLSSVLMYSLNYIGHFFLVLIFIGISFFVFKRNYLLQNEKEIIVQRKKLSIFMRYENGLQLFVLLIGLLAISAITSRLFSEHTSLLD
ncbi:hypothetical protein CLU81_0560 [Flavobacterium sp. 9]|uniref:hypothetical protein n=1 Tax=Flavobacterium sp. 9 TaxID=2035198 RepID=UPI000C5B1478|nr:hypothetical protein [Flavobacterium sp. 9]PIF30154.1 hypothetical protein CLU81_0560 [Flavobacterium sp. 9]